MHQRNVSPVRPLENVEDGSSDGGGREDREDDEQDEGVPEVIPVTRKLHHLPSTAEQELRNRTHVPLSTMVSLLRFWPEGQLVSYGNAVPEVYLDYCFFKKKPGGKSAPTFVLKDRDAKALAAHVVPYKGGDLEWAVKQAGRDLIKW